MPNREPASRPATPTRRPDGRPADQRYIVPGLERGLRILGLFERERRPLGLPDIAKILGLSRSTAFRLIYTLETFGFLERLPDDAGFRPTSAVLRLGYAYLASLDIIEIAEPTLRRLRDRTNAAVHLARLEGREVVYLSRFVSNGRLTSNIQVGGRLPAHATSLGRALLLGLDEAALETLYRDAPMSAHTPHTATTVEALKAQLAEDRARGYVMGRGIFEAELDTVAAPVTGRDGTPVAAISIVGTGLGLDHPERRTWLAREIQRASADIANALI